MKIIYKDYVSTTTAESSKNVIPKIENKTPYPITVKTVEHPNFLIVNFFYSANILIRKKSKISQ